MDTLDNHPRLFNVNTFDGILTASYGYGFPNPMKVNCKKGIVRQPKNYFTKFKPPSMRRPIDKNFKGSNVYLTDSGWFLSQYVIDKGKVMAWDDNYREVQQMRTSALYDYFCVGPKQF